jgi:hypothetical protein
MATFSGKVLALLTSTLTPVSLPDKPAVKVCAVYAQHPLRVFVRV